ITTLLRQRRCEQGQASRLLPVLQQQYVLGRGILQDQLQCAALNQTVEIGRFKRGKTYRKGGSHIARTRAMHSVERANDQGRALQKEIQRRTVHLTVECIKLPQ